MSAGWWGFCFWGFVCATACHAYDPNVVHELSSCARKTPPTRPDVDDGPDVEPSLFALKDLVLDQNGERWREIGYDVDERCTTADHLDLSCAPADPSADPILDGDGGLDNALGQTVLPLMLVLYPEMTYQMNHSHDIGQGVILVHIDGWNGKDDDPQVRAFTAQSAFGTPPLDDGSVPQDVLPPSGLVNVDVEGEHPPYPDWARVNYWWARDDQFLYGELSQPKIGDDHAYIAERTLVMSLPDRQDIVFSGGGQTTVVRLTDAHLVGRISDDGTRLEPAAVYGRWSIEDFLATAGFAGFCETDAVYPYLLTLLHRAADVRSDARTSGDTVESQPCNALSMAIPMTGYRGALAGLAPGQPRFDFCGTRAP